MQLFKAVPMTPLRWPEISPICPDLQKAVVNTVYFSENLLAVLLTPANSLSAVSLTPANSLSAVSLTPANNSSAVLLTPAITFFPSVVDTGQK
jgi:hypothetical protein